jgi:hypothetical protein
VRWTTDEGQEGTECDTMHLQAWLPSGRHTGHLDCTAQDLQCNFALTPQKLPCIGANLIILFHTSCDTKAITMDPF